MKVSKTNQYGFKHHCFDHLSKFSFWRVRSNPILLVQKLGLMFVCNGDTRETTTRRAINRSSGLKHRIYVNDGAETG